MNPVTLFLTSLGQALAGMSLYANGHPVREAATSRTLTALHHVLDGRGMLRLSFLDGDVIVGTRVLTELRGWDWGVRLARVEIQRLEIDALPLPTASDVDALLLALHERLVAPANTPFSSLTVRGMRAGPLGVRSSTADALADEAEVDAMLANLAQDSLEAETDAVRWIHDEVARAHRVPMAEVEAVVHSLAASLRRDQHLMAPLINLQRTDASLTAHACNVAMLTMGMAESLGLPSSGVRELGGAALLHDIGKVTALDDERAHPVEGARVLSARGGGNELAAVVAYEHHVWDDGSGGYPLFTYARRCHFASRLVRVCNAFDALSAGTAGREALPQADALAFLESGAGTRYDAELVQVLAALVRS